MGVRTLDEQSTQTREQDEASLPTQEDTTIVSDKNPQAVVNQEQQIRIRQQAHHHLQARQWSQAEDMFLQLLAYDAQDKDALLGIATALDEQSKFEALHNLAQHILEFTPDSAQALAFKARALQKLERLSAATIANDQALLLDTNLGLAWINRSGLQLLQGKFPEALRSSQRALELAPEDSRAWANKGVALLNFNRLSEALDAFDRSLECDEQQTFALQMKGEILCRIGRMREVVPLVQRSLALNPNNPNALMQGIQAVRALEMYDSLKELAHALLQLLPDNLFAWDNYMRGLRGLGQFEEADAALNRLLELDPGNFRFWTLKADTLYRMEHYRDAANAAERARSLEPDYPPALRIHDKALRLMYQRKGIRRQKPDDVPQL
ncbi:MAG TPA: tetratricopeptide repeat protein [Dictyobacter sp.]|nr:tetratricopeptide repeat protein [Dictyobacter sp.]